MAISVFASFRAYALFSILLTTGIISHAFYTKRFFFRSVVHLANSKLAIMSMFNMALMLVILAWRIVQFLFLGPLRFRERERLHLRARDAIIESCFAMSIFRSEFNLMFVSIVITLLFVKSLHWLAKDRIEFLEEQPLSPRRAHVRLVSLLLFLLFTDSLFIVKSVFTTFESNKSMFALFVFEFAILIVELLSDFVRYVFLVVDLSMDGRWDGKNLYSFYNELMSDLCQLTLYIIFFAYIQIKYNQFPYHIIRELYMTFVKFQRRFSDFLRYRRVLATMNDIFAEATEEQLAEGDRTCIICREEMTAAKTLSCGHMFHARCLQSWLKRQLSCPTCRANIDVNPTVRQGQGANPRNANDNGDPNNVNQNANPNANGGNPQGPARAAADPVQLANVANEWWERLFQGAADGAAQPGAVQGQIRGRARAAPNMRPPQNAGANLNLNAFGAGPNALAHQQLRARRRIAWGYPVQPGFGVLPNWPPMAMVNHHLPGMPVPFLNPDGNGNANGNVNTNTEANRPNAHSSTPGPSTANFNERPTGNTGSTSSVEAASSSATPSTNTGVPARTLPVEGEAVSFVGSVPGSTMTRGAETGLVNSTTLEPSRSHGNANAQKTLLPLEHLLNIQEQIELLRSEVEELVLLATNGDGEINVTNCANRDKSSAGASTSTVSRNEHDAKESESSGNENRPTGGPSGNGERDAEEDEAARIRRHRIEFLENRQSM